jgi:hypothetical protein
LLINNVDAVSSMIEKFIEIEVMLYGKRTDCLRKMGMFLMSATKKSACEIKRQMSPVWLMHRLREAMGKRDERYQLEGKLRGIKKG